MPPQKFTPEARTKILTALKLCAPRETAAEIAGITSKTLRSWLSSKAPKYREFQADVARVEGETERKLVSTIIKAGSKDWKASAWILERKYRRNWGYKARIEFETQERVENELERFLNVVEEHLPPDQATKLLEVFAASAGGEETEG